MQAFIARQFAKSKAIPNTFIGGIAKTGGTGVNAPIDTPYKLSQKLGIAVNRITGFRVVGDDVECRIRGNYYIPQNAFGHNSDTNLANKNITNYYDEDDLVSFLGGACFRFTNLNAFKFDGVTSVDTVTHNGYQFGNTKLVSASLPLVTNARYLFRGTTTLTYVDMPSLITSYGVFRECTNPNLEVNMPNCENVQEHFMQLSSAFDGSTYTGWSAIKELRRFAFYNSYGFEEVNIPNATSMVGNQNFNSPRNIKRFYLNNVETITGTTPWYQGNRSCELIEIKKAKTLPNDLMAYGTSSLDMLPHPSNFTMRVNESVSGHISLLNIRDAYPWVVIELYDDAGNYVGLMP